jgi:SagB-type dehydrogenase family enzyme
MDGGVALRKRLGVVVSLALLAVLVATFLTGFVAAALDLNRFAYHKYAAYAAIALAAAHVVLHWRALAGQVRRWILNRAAPLPATRAGEAGGGRLSRRRLFWPGLALAAGAGVGRLAGAGAAPVTIEPGDDLGQIYHRWSMTSYSGALAKALHVGAPPEVYKLYGDAPVVRLPPAPPPGGPAFETVIASRRSVREYGDRTVSLEELSRLLQHSIGITDRRDPTYHFRSVPSSGALYPVELYLAVFNVAGLEPGIYHYRLEEHAVELLRRGDFRRDLFQIAVSQEMVLRSALVVVLTGIFTRVQWKYVDRSYRYIMLEGGHVGQNVYLEATALGLGACGIGAFLDDRMNELLAVDGRDEATIYLLSVGAPA